MKMVFEYFLFGDLSLTIEKEDEGNWKIVIDEPHTYDKTIFRGVPSYKDALATAKRFCKSKIDVWNGLLKQIEEEEAK